MSAGAGKFELDVTDAQAVFDRIAEAQPDVVLHCAAYTDVDRAEEQELVASLVNRDGANHVTAAAGRHGAFVVSVSTDYVFGGDAGQPYVESDPTGPRTAYGRTKLAGEKAVKSVGTPYAIARTAWLYGAGGRNFVDTMLTLAQDRDEVTVVNDQVGCPTWTGHLAPALIEVAERQLQGVHHLAGAGACTWYELAVEALRPRRRGLPRGPDHLGRAEALGSPAGVERARQRAARRGRAAALAGRAGRLPLGARRRMRGEAPVTAARVADVGLISADRREARG